MNWLEKIRKTVSLDDARQAANDHKEAVKSFIFEIKKERAIIHSTSFSDEMKKQMEKYL